MTNPTPRPAEPKAGGFFIAIGTLAGAIIGGQFGQPVIGLLAGLGVGALISVILWRMH